MKKILRYISIMFAFVCAFLLKVDAHATGLYTKLISPTGIEEIENELVVVADVPEELQGELGFDCNVKFIVTDFSGEYPGTSFTVTMQDVTNTVTQDFVIQRAASWANSDGNIPTITVPAPTTYNITISGLDEGYKLRDLATGNDIDSSFAATNHGEVIFSWEIVKDDSFVNDSASENAEVVVTDADAVENVVADNEEAEKVYEEFLNDISFIRDDPTWKDFVELLDIPINLDASSKIYAENVDVGSRTEDEAIAEFKEMPSFDRMLWDTTYLFLADMITKGNFADASNYEAVIGHTASATYYISVTGERNDRDKVLAAYEKLYQWQVDYINTNGSPFNFINNRTYLEERGVTPAQVEEKKEDIEAVAEKEIEMANKEIEQVINEDEKDKEESLWGGVLDSLSKNLITFVLLLGLAGALGYVMYLKKKNNYSEEIHEK